MGVSAVVLAAGRSERMGEPKQMLRLGSRSMLEQTLENVRASGVDEIVLVLGFASEAIRRELSESLLDGVRVVVNEKYESGMASSLRAGLTAVSPAMKAALIVLADQPSVRSETMGHIIDAYCESAAKIVVPYYKGRRGNPVLLDRSVFSEAMALEGDVGCRAIFAKHPEAMASVEVDDPAILADIDTRDDYERVYPTQSKNA